MKYLPHIDAFEFSDNEDTIVMTHTQHIEDSFRILSTHFAIEKYFKEKHE